MCMPGYALNWHNRSCKPVCGEKIFVDVMKVIGIQKMAIPSADMNAPEDATYAQNGIVRSAQLDLLFKPIAAFHI